VFCGVRLGVAFERGRCGKVPLLPALWCSILSECVPFLVSVFSGAANRSEDARKEAGRKAARTRAERYGEELKVSAEENDDLKGTDTTK